MTFQQCPATVDSKILGQLAVNKEYLDEAMNRRRAIQYLVALGGALAVGREAQAAESLKRRAPMTN